MKIYQVVFSPTGGTKKVADILCRSCPGGFETIDLCRTDFTGYTFEAEDICLVAVPSFGGRVPDIAADRLAMLCGKNARAVLAAVYGNRAIDDTLIELKDILQKAGFRCSAAVSAVAEHSICRQYGAGRPDASDEKELHDFAYNIMAKILDGSVSSDVAVPGSRPYREYKNGPMKPSAGKDCTKCGLCARECPLSAIPADKPDTTIGEKCITCMRCVSICPNHARSLNKLMEAAITQKLKKPCESRKPNELFII